MAMYMGQAFDASFLVSLTLYSQAAGSYNDDNDWISGGTTSSTVSGVVQAGNKFAQFEEGMAVHNEDGGTRTSDYRSLYILSSFNLELGDKLGYQGVYYNILQQSDESPFGFDSFLLEKSKNWSPT